MYNRHHDLQVLVTRSRCLRWQIYGIYEVEFDQLKLAAFNPLIPSIKLKILLSCHHTFLIEVVGRSC